ncbi:hypothetical protein [Geobacter sp. AOG1]|uniref:hypothetical protein n=1 Tax=Geobacter sp. AOG1 TaxID=1566346 RepID=UPI001CC4840F|nr:hypothetical protein [Geobacter sp. AOG1]GFE58867.1 hypothetical protein AOG1_27470 [Geobacter sp. AOG1]
MVSNGSNKEGIRDGSARATGGLPILGTVLRCGFGCIVIALLLVKSVHASVPSDSQLFMDSFNLFRNKNYPSSLANLNSLLAIYPDTPLRDMALLLQAQANAKMGNQLDAAQALVKFLKEYPDSPLKVSANSELANLAIRLQRGEKLANRLSAPQATAGNSNFESQVVTKEELESIGSKETEEERLARLKVDEERIAREKVERDRLAAAKAEEERLAKEKTKQDKLARQRAEEERIASENAERERLARVKAEQERIAREKAERERLAVAKAEEERLAKEKAEQDKLARQRAEEERIASENAERERLARVKAEQERITAQNAELERLRREHIEKEQIEAQKREDERVVERNAAIEMGRRASTVIKRAETQHTTVAAVTTGPSLTIPSEAHVVVSPESTPQSSSLVVAADAQAVPTQTSIPAPSPPEFSLECFPPGENSEVARMVSIPFTITNLGVEPDRYRITTDLPTDFNVTFAAVGRPGRLLRETETVAPSATFRGIIKLRLPGKSIDGQTFTLSLTAVSTRDANIAVSKKLHLVAAAPLLSTVIKPLKKRAAPGETVAYRLILMNVGSMAAREVAMKLMCPPALEPASIEDSGFRRETDGSLVTEGIELPTGRIREFALTFRVSTMAAHDTTLSCRLDTEDRQLGNTLSVTSGNVLVSTH